ncbi:general stress protein [Kocuria sp.]|uniref:general stress protein n=1 Tax=Kocuria sp. TaxID=1871328 RepID=UPI00289E4253|nr:general stress protein [Kocuria sp.]
MSNSKRGPAQLSIAPEMPRGEVVGRYRTYALAQKAVDYMADEHFPVAMVSIIGSDLKSVEQVTGRLSYPKVALQGALNGLVFGAFFGLLMSLLGGANMASSLLLTMILGGAFWMLMATITYAMSRGKRDFTSTSRIVAGSYEVLAAPEVAGQARQVLNGMEGGHVVGQRGQNPGQGYRGPAGPQGNQYPGGPQHGGPAQGGPQYGGPAQGGRPGAPVHGAPVQGDPGGQNAPGGSEPRYGVFLPGADQQQEDTNRSAKFPDLPDGRPQYGIRLEPSDTAPAGGQPAPQAPANAAAPSHPAADAPAPSTDGASSGTIPANPAQSADRAAPWTQPGTPEAPREGGSTPHNGQDTTQRPHGEDQR